MTAELIDGAKIAARVREEVKEAVARMPVKPGLATILVGDDPPRPSTSARSGAPASNSGSATCTSTCRRRSRRRRLAA